ncbi:MAG: DUF86 domain-containing protein [Acidobacteria bacterium]|nr:DUF86 domain-containing protein [Acidobacteriota bacterium]
MKQRDLRKYLYDLIAAAELIQKFLSGKTLDDYLNDSLLRSGVERQFEIIGEALRQASEVDRSISERITGFRRVIDFRNQLIHGYMIVRNEIVWAVAENDLPVLIAEVQRFMDELNSDQN